MLIGYVYLSILVIDEQIWWFQKPGGVPMLVNSSPLQGEYWGVGRYSKSAVCSYL